MVLLSASLLACRVLTVLLQLLVIRYIVWQYVVCICLKSSRFTRACTDLV